MLFFEATTSIHRCDHTPIPRQYHQMFFIRESDCNRSKWPRNIDENEFIGIGVQEDNQPKRFGGETKLFTIYSLESMPSKLFNVLGDFVR